MFFGSRLIDLNFDFSKHDKSEMEWIECTTGKLSSDERKSNPEKRKCMQSEESVDFGYIMSQKDRDLINGEVKSIVVNSYDFQPQYRREYVKNAFLGVEWTLLKYEKDGFFAKHVDKKLKKSHIGTILLIPPTNESSEFEGGQLTIWHESDDWDDTKIANVIVPDTTKWTLVVFELGQDHEVSPVLKGTRYVYKGITRYNYTKLEKDRKEKGYSSEEGLCD